jgi:hypothetical protein
MHSTANCMVARMVTPSLIHVLWHRITPTKTKSCHKKCHEDKHSIHDCASLTSTCSLLTLRPATVGTAGPLSCLRCMVGWALQGPSTRQTMPNSNSCTCCHGNTPNTCALSQTTKATQSNNACRVACLEVRVQQFASAEFRPYFPAFVFSRRPQGMQKTCLYQLCRKTLSTEGKL